MKTGRFSSVLILLATVWLLGITETVAQTNKSAFKLNRSKWDFVIEKGEESDYTIPDYQLYPWIEYQYTKDWNIRFASSEHLNETAQAGIVTDSTFNETTYQVVEIKKNGDMTDSLLYRQEGKKVYRYSETDKKDVLLFDFGLNVGDDFTTPNGEVWTVNAMNEMVLYGGQTGNSFTLKGKEDGMFKDIWLENVGSLYTGILIYNDFENGSLPQLVYCRQSDDSPWLFDVDTELFKIVYFSELKDDENFFKTITSEELTFINQTRQEEGFILMDNLLANFIGDTLRIYGKMWMNCYTYSLECRITDHEILLKVNDIHYGEEADCFTDKYVDIRIPKIKAGNYTIKYVSMYADNGKEQILESTPSSVGCLPSADRIESIFAIGSTITCTSPTATKLEIYTMDAVKVGEAAFASGEATVKVSKIPATYLYIVTYPNGKRESGKVAVKN